MIREDAVLIYRDILEALLLMSVDPLVSMVLLMSMDSCERTVETVEFANLLTIAVKNL
jgi:hypothetical protein